MRGLSRAFWYVVLQRSRFSIRCSQRQVYVPTGLLATLEPTLTAILTRVARKLTDYENYQTADSYEAAMVQKVFVFNLITAYLPVFLTAFVYIPFGHLITPYLDILRLSLQLFSDNSRKLTKLEMPFHTDPARLRREVIHFGVTAQIVDQLKEVVVPYLKHEWFRWMKHVRDEHSTTQGTGKSGLCVNDPPEEASFLARVRNEADLDDYDVNVDLREMCMQVSRVNLRTLYYHRDIADVGNAVWLSYHLLYRLASGAAMLPYQ